MKIISIAGMPCSGKKILREEFEKRNIPVIVLSRIVREEMMQSGQVIDNKTLREYATKIRRVYGYDIVAKKCIPHIEKYRCAGIVALDGIRGMAEVDLLKKEYGENFILIGVHSSPQTRFSRMLKRCSPSDAKTYEEFEYRERTEFEWGLGDAISRCDFMLVNEDKTIEALREEFNRILNKILESGNKELSEFMGQKPLHENDDTIMIVQKAALFGSEVFEGFRYTDEQDYESNILNNFRWVKRAEIETDDLHKQLIGYGIIVNPRMKKVFVYKRPLDEEKCSETRLIGKWSWGIGGHIKKCDVLTGNPIRTSMVRKLKEEIELLGPVNLVLIGYINNESDDVGKAHFGILYLIETNSPTVTPKSSKLESGKLCTLEEVEAICSLPGFVVEEWSKIAVSSLKKYFEMV